MLIPISNRAPFFDILEKIHARKKCSLATDSKTGETWIDTHVATAWQSSKFYVGIEPELNFVIAGKGPEAYSFGSLVQSIGYNSLLMSPDLETLAIASQLGCTTLHLRNASLPNEIEIDQLTAVVLFFHDHEWEPNILSSALKSRSFYIGAQGSVQTSKRRKDTLNDMGVAPHQIRGLRGPIGLVPSAKDARTLAVSVLAEILDVAKAKSIAISE